MKIRTFWLALALLAVVRLVLMATMPVFDPSEARYAAISANMARTGDYVVPHFTHNGRYQSFDGKPPLVFQAGGACCRVLGTESPLALQLAVRLFPFASAATILLILYLVVRRFSDAATGRLAVMITATSVAFYGASGIAMTDMTLTACVAGALLFYRCFLERQAWWPAVGVAVLLGVGMMVKGPVAMVMFGLPVLADALVNRRWGGLFTWKWLAVLPAFLLVAVPWFVLIEQRNPGSVWYFFYNENFLRFVTPDYGDKYGAGREAFRGVAVLWVIVATLPWTLFVAWKRPFWRSFPFLSLLAITGFWCLTSRVLLYYLFPVIPLFAADLAIYGNRERLWRVSRWAVGLCVVAVSAGLVGTWLTTDKMEGVKAPPYFGYFNRYSHEFYHGTRPEARGEGVDPKFVFGEVMRAKAERGEK